MKPETYLNSFINFESHLHKVSSRNFNLERVRRLLTTLGDPQKGLRFVHVAGTKGKGSTCIFISYILRAAGYRVGLYTSPHLYRIHERIRILDPGGRRAHADFEGSIADGELKALLKELKPKLEQHRSDPIWGNLTYFEALTATALCYFARKRTDIVVLETGLGGRLDATNAADALVNLITPISFDHTHLLGKTLGKIAREKAAIIKHAYSSVVISCQDPKARAVILERCKDVGCKTFVVGKDIKCVQRGPSGFSVHGWIRHYPKLKISLPGEHQRQNAAAAIGVIESLSDFGYEISPAAVRKGLKQARWPGRFEIIGRRPVVIVDCAHNVDSAQALVRTFRDRFPGKKSVLLLGISADKEVDGICRVLKPVAGSVVLTRARHPRAHVFDRDRIGKIFKGRFVTEVLELPNALREGCRLAGSSGVVIATGSIFLVAQVRGQVKHVSV